MSKILEFPKAKQAPAEVGHQGRALYDLYRQARIEQGWEEFKWESLSAPQRLVWARIMDRLGMREAR